MRSLAPYPLAELEEMKNQGCQLIAAMTPSNQDFMIKVLAAINAELERREQEQMLSLMIVPKRWSTN